MCLLLDVWVALGEYLCQGDTGLLAVRLEATNLRDYIGCLDVVLFATASVTVCLV